MRAVKEIELAGRKVLVKEMTLGEIRAWLAEVVDQSRGDAIDALLFEDFDPLSLIRMSDISAADLDSLTPTDLRSLAAACREINRDFFGMRERMAAAQRALLSQISNAQA